MPKTRRNKSKLGKITTFLKRVANKTNKYLPVINSGVKKVGKTTKKVAYKAKPIIEKSSAVIYNTIASGFDLGIKGTKKSLKYISKSRSNR